MGLTAVDLSRQFGGLKKLFAAKRGAFGAVHGPGEAEDARLRSAIAMSWRHLDARMDRDAALASPAPAPHRRPASATLAAKSSPACRLSTATG